MGVDIIHPIIALGGLIVFLMVAHLLARPLKTYEWRAEEVKSHED